MAITKREALSLSQLISDRDPDFVGHYTENYRVETSIGTALLRRARLGVFDGFDPRMMLEADALAAAYARGARVPKVLYTADDFLIERYIEGSQPSVDNLDQLTWLPDLLAQIRTVQAHEAPRSMVRNVYDWQLWMEKFLIELHANLPEAHQLRVRSLGVPPLRKFWSPDPTQAHRRSTLVHSDLHPSNLLMNDVGVWILDWELAMTADPVWEAAVSLHRTPWPDISTKEHAASLWLELFDTHRPSALAELVQQYETIEIWKSLLVDSRRFPEAIAADPTCLPGRAQAFHSLLATGSRLFGCAELSLDDTQDLLLTWSQPPTQ